VAHREDHPIGVMQPGPRGGEIGPGPAGGNGPPAGEPGSERGESMADLDTSSAQQIEEMGPIDYIVIEWPGEQPTGEAIPLIIDLVDRGIIRLLDIAFVGKDENGGIYAIDLAQIAAAEAGFDAFEGASSGLIGAEDLEEAAAVLANGTSAAVMIWENRWAAPVAIALRRSGGQLVASGRIPVQAMVAALDAIESTP
jgi:hypothetical protein